MQLLLTKGVTATVVLLIHFCELRLCRVSMQTCDTVMRIVSSASTYALHSLTPSVALLCSQLLLMTVCQHLLHVDRNSSNQNT